MLLGNDRCIAEGPEDNVVNQFRVGHAVVGAPLQGACTVVVGPAGRSDPRLLRGDRVAVISFQQLYQLLLAPQ